MSLASFFFGRRIRTFLSILAILALAGCSSPEEQAQSHYKRGLELIEANDPVKAKLEFLNAVRLDSKLVDAWYQLAKFEERAANWGAANAHAGKVIELNPDHVGARKQLAKIQLLAGKLNKALEHVNRSLKLEPNDAPALATRAAALLRLADLSGARKDAEAALALEPGNSDAHVILGAAALREENTKSALQYAEAGLAAAPENAALLLLKFKIHELEKDVGKQEAVLRKLIETQPKNKGFRQALLALLNREKRSEEITSELKEMVKEFPDDASIALQLVQYVGRSQGADAARKQLDALIAARPNAVEYKLALAELRFRQKAFDDAEKILAKIIDAGEPLTDVTRARNVLAQMLLRRRETDRAAKQVAETLAADAKNADALALRASIRIDANQIDDAIADIREALDQQSSSVPLHRLMGRAYEKKGSLELAQERYGQAVKLAQHAPRLALEFAQFLLRNGKLSEAEAVLSEASLRHPSDLRVLRGLGQVRLRSRDWIGAQKVAETLKQLEDPSGADKEILSVSLIGQKRVQQGIEVLKDTATTNLGVVRPMFMLVRTYMSVGQFDEAEKFLKSALAANDENAEAHVLLGNVHLARKESSKAEEAFKQAIEKQPKKPAGYAALGNYYISQGDLDKAKAALTKGRENASDSFVVSFSLANVLETRKECEQAIEVYKSLLKSRPNAVVVKNNLASLLIDCRQDPESLQQAAEFAPDLKKHDVPHFKDTLGWIAYRQGNFAEAVTYLEEASKKLPNMAVVRFHFAQALAAINRTPEAVAEFEKAAALAKNDPVLLEKIQKTAEQAKESKPAVEN